jgi:hypothetical protein
MKRLGEGKNRYGFRTIRLCYKHWGRNKLCKFESTFTMALHVDFTQHLIRI